MDVLLPMVGALMLRRAVGWVDRTNGDHVFVDVVTMNVVKMPIVQIVGVIAVLHHHMSALRPMLMAVFLVSLLFVWHCHSFRDSHSVLIA